VSSDEFTMEEGQESTSQKANGYDSAITISTVKEYKLCPRCKNLLDKRHQPHMETLGRQSSIFENGCMLCQIALESADTNNVPGDPNPVLFIEVFPTLNIFQDLEGSALRGFDTGFTYSIRAGAEHVDFEPVVPSLWIGPDDRKTNGKCHRWLTPLAEGQNLHRPFYAQFLTDQVEFNFVRSWILSCTAEHHACREPDVETQYSPIRALHSPIRVIDCVGRRVRWREDQEPYLTLSYVWGDTKTRGQFLLDPSSTTMLPNDLPALIEDAIQTTVSCGYICLWIDFYCINQRDELEVKSQVSQMGSIYTLSDATIISATCQNPSQPLPGVRKGSRLSSRETVIGGEKYLWFEHPRIENSLWHSRGWTYQEAVMSRRRIIFLKDRLYLECNTSIQLEGMNLPSIAAKQWAPNFLFKSMKWNDEEPLRQLYHHFCRYVVRNMSFESDILQGFAGILQADGYPMTIVGIPFVDKPSSDSPVPTLSERFAAGLLWCSTNVMERRDEFPSWSWTGWRNKKDVTHGPWRDTAVHNPYLKIEMEFEPTKVISLEELTTMSSSPPIRYIHITAPTLNIRLRRVHSQLMDWTVELPEDSGRWFTVLENYQYLHTNMSLSVGSSVLATAMILHREFEEVHVLLVVGSKNGPSPWSAERIGTAMLYCRGFPNQATQQLDDGEWYRDVQTVRLG
jgi:hypothetical protein